MIFLIFLGAAYPAYATLEHVRDRMILADRGVQVDVWVVDRNWVRKGPDTMVVRPDDPPYFETTLHRWRGDLAFNDRLDVVYDPHDPGRVVTVDEPLVDGQVLLFASLDLLALAFLLTAVGELLRRAPARRRDEVAPDSAGRPPVRPRPRRPLAGWEAPQIVLLLIIGPVLGAAIFGLLTASSLSDAAALRTTGVTARAVVVKSVWDGAGDLDVRFPIQDGTRRTAHVVVRDGVYYEGDPVDVVYEPADPRNARLAGQSDGNSPLWIYTAAFAAVAATAAVSVTTAISTLVCRSRGAGPTPGQGLGPAFGR